MTKIFSAMVVVALCLGLGSSVLADGATVMKDVPIGGLLPSNDCTGEDLILSGTAKIVIRGNGGVHLGVSDVSAEGVDSGTIWEGVGVSTQNGSTRSGENGATVTTVTFKIRLKSGDTTFSQKLTTHITMNANGDVTSEVELENTSCR